MRKLVAKVLSVWLVNALIVAMLCVLAWVSALALMGAG